MSTRSSRATHVGRRWASQCPRHRQTSGKSRYHDPLFRRSFAPFSPVIFVAINSVAGCGECHTICGDRANIPGSIRGHCTLNKLPGAQHTKVLGIGTRGELQRVRGSVYCLPRPFSRHSSSHVSQDEVLTEFHALSLVKCIS